MATDATGSLEHKDTDEIRQDIDETRSAITEKLEALEGQVRDTVQSAKDTVEDTITSAKETVEETISTVKSSVEETVESVKSSVHDTVQTVKRTFDLSRQVDEHPWPMFGGSVAAGFVVGKLLSGSGRSRADYARPWYAAPATPSAYTSSAARPLDNGPAAPPPSPAEPSGPGWVQMFDDEIKKAKGFAIGMLMGAVRDWAKQTFPQMRADVAGLIDDVTVKLGGHPVPQQEGTSSSCGGSF